MAGTFGDQRKMRVLSRFMTTAIERLSPMQELFQRLNVATIVPLLSTQVVVTDEANVHFYRELILDVNKEITTDFTQLEDLGEVMNQALPYPALPSYRKGSDQFRQRYF